MAKKSSQNVLILLILLSLSLSDNYSLDNGLETAALAYSNRVISNVIGTVDGVRHLVENECASGVKEKLGVGHEGGFIPLTLIVGCSIGGMIEGTIKGVASLPGRVVDLGKRLFSGLAENVGEALADLNFFAIELAGYGQMGIGAVQAFKGGAPVSVPLSNNNIVGFSGGGAVVVSQPAWTSALAAVGDICIASGEAAVGVAAASSDDFGGPMATPRPVLETYGDKAVTQRGKRVIDTLRFRLIQSLGDLEAELKKMLDDSATDIDSVARSFPRLGRHVREWHQEGMLRTDLNRLIAPLNELKGRLLDPNAPIRESIQRVRSAIDTVRDTECPLLRWRSPFRKRLLELDHRLREVNLSKKHLDR